MTLALTKIRYYAKKLYEKTVTKYNRRSHSAAPCVSQWLTICSAVSWHQFGGPNQTRYRDKGTSNRLSDAFESTVAGPSFLAFTQPTNEDASLTYLANYGPKTPYTEDTGTLFSFTASRNCSLGGLQQGLPNRRLVLVSQSQNDAFLTIKMESTASEPQNRFRSSKTEIVIAPGGSASFVYIILRDSVVGRWQLTGQG